MFYGQYDLGHRGNININFSKICSKVTAVTGERVYIYTTSGEAF